MAGAASSAVNSVIFFMGELPSFDKFLKICLTEKGQEKERTRSPLHIPYSSNIRIIAQILEKRKPFLPDSFLILYKKIRRIYGTAADPAVFSACAASRQHRRAETA